MLIGFFKPGSVGRTFCHGNTALVGGQAKPYPWPHSWQLRSRGRATTWMQQGNELVATNSVITSGVAGLPLSFAVALSADGNIAALNGLVETNVGSGAACAVWIFTRNTGGQWSQQGGNLIGNTTETGGKFRVSSAFGRRQYLNREWPIRLRERCQW
jgi:hypothetical protein